VLPFEDELSDDEVLDDGVLDVDVFVDEVFACWAAAVAGWLSVHAIAVPRESAAATLTAPTARRARLARGGLRGRGWVMGGSRWGARCRSIWTDATESG
jgi:hypothetical protein